MSELLKKRVNDSIGKRAKIFLHNNFRYEGRLTNADQDFVEVLDIKTNSYKIILYKDIKDMEVES